MWKSDWGSRELGMELVDVAAGRADLALVVTDRMVNGHQICHGGYIFTLADSAFAYACNGYNQRTVGLHCTITYIVAARIGDRLTARALERSRTGRNGIYDITVTRDDGVVIAEFRGSCRTIEGEVVEAGRVQNTAVG
jgi:acyl-CoA thioesterase